MPSIVGCDECILVMPHIQARIQQISNTTENKLNTIIKILNF